MSGARLRLLDRAEKEIMKLPRSVKGAIYDFQHKFRNNPENKGLRLKQLKGHAQLYSARVNDDYRALLLHAGGVEYVLVAVKPRGEVYDHLDRYRPQINPVTGGIEFVDLVVAAETLTARPPAPAAEPAAQRAPIFAAHPDERLVELGVAEPLLPLVRKLTTEEELLALAEYAPQLTGEVLLALYDGRTPDEVLEQVTAPVAVEEKIDTGDYAAALERPATAVTTGDADLREILEQSDFGRWKVFLHPAQRKLVERAYRGPARVSGGPGTGKTIVALHRVRHLVERLPAGGGKSVLFTTFNKNLAADLQQRLIALAGPDVAARVHITNIDKLAAEVVAEIEHGRARRRIDDGKARELWDELLAETGDNRWDAAFLNEEWTQVILGQGLKTRAEYFRARRAGRGRPLSRKDRADLWKLTERYVMLLEDRGVSTLQQVTERAAQLEAARARDRAAYAERPALQDESGMRNRPRYRHIVVDEAQDLSAAHWRMLRAMVDPGADDLFIVGDSHQRIYGNQVSLGALGIAIRGRSSRLTLSYRTTHEILGTAVRLLGTETWDDLDDGGDDLTGYRSVLRGRRPGLRGFRDWNAELDGIAAQVAAWGGDSIAVCVPERRMVADVERRLAADGVVASAITGDGPRHGAAPVHVGTMHRFKGLEYQRMIVAGIAEGLVPPAWILRLADEDAVRYGRELRRFRSLLFVAVTRARDDVVISWHGDKSRFLP
ncbi:UvrD-helicase domain-containing protein [Actinomadura algeriensis]|uniref:DNA 3'-5' helicase n=1 Tax=Actinomadura algeriensis TaxID=1679523 RepID=A0ABR9JPX1_9ACTN|nr:UvrD-helicase domain-containing protein [Actinomadura algeriensis]MBE1532602.1 mRNA-degrading endonuclease RelE of RelBE toxin-antitoxin system [Actinomadura algeriensis]